MTEEIKEILHLLKRCDNTYLKIENSNGEKEYEYHQVNDLRLNGYHSQLLLDYITNLQQDLDKANGIIEKDRQFNQGRLLDIAELKEENERLKQSLFKSANNTNKAMEQTEIYKSRCEKAKEYIEERVKYKVEPFYLSIAQTNILYKILQGSDEK